VNVEIFDSYGQRAIDISLIRHKDGIKVRVKVTPEVEAFFKNIGGGVTDTPRHGRLWRSLIDGHKLTMWAFERPINADLPYNLFHGGTDLINEMGNVNMSFVRLCGASEEGGREFVCDTVMSRSELDSIALKMRKAAEHLYTEFIQPVHLNIFVGVRDLTRG
jgi:hypothetical protein